MHVSVVGKCARIGGSGGVPRAILPELVTCKIEYAMLHSASISPLECCPAPAFQLIPMSRRRTPQVHG